MEKKKIQAKPKLNASAQEALLNKLQQNSENSVFLQQNTAKENVEAEEAASTVEKEEITVNLQQNIENAVNSSNDTVLAVKATKIQRITVDMPIELYEKMKDEVEDNGQTIKGFIVNLVKFHFTKKI
jgi:hypothetical protein